MADSIVSRATDQDLSNQGFVYEDGVRNIFNQVLFINEKKFHMGQKRNAQWILYDLIDLESWKERKKEKENGENPSFQWPTSSVQHDEKKIVHELECKSFKIHIQKMFESIFLVHFSEEPKVYRPYDPKVNLN